jgi:hypothetical protein
MNDFDIAADAARKELDEILTAENASELLASELVTWFAKWYRTAGHKRLGRMLVKLAA